MWLLQNSNQLHVYGDSLFGKMALSVVTVCLFHLELRLFAKEATEYDLLADVQKSFEPYCDLWKRVDDWMSWHKGWMNDAFLSLDAEEVIACIVCIDREFRIVFLWCAARKL